MHAILCESFGETPVLGDVERPALGPRQVRVRQSFSSIGAGDALMAAGRPWVIRPLFAAMLRTPVLGRDVAGVVVELGEGVETFSVDDRVVGEAGHAWGEEVVVPAEALARVPDDVDLREAATLPVSATTALHGLRDVGRVGEGSRVLVVGASGGVGHFAVQIAVALGARVTGVCSADKAPRVRELGAERTLDYRTERFTDERGVWDVILDLAGTEPLAHCVAALAPDGIYVSSAGANGGWLLGPIPRIAGVGVRSLFDRRVVTFSNTSSADDLDTLLAMMERGELHPWIGNEVDLDQAPDAVERVLEGRSLGKTVIRFPAVTESSARA